MYIETEMKIKKLFDEHSNGRMVFVIAYRLSTIKNTDSIAVVENEKIIEYGTR